MRHGVESQALLKQLSIELQELARVCRASIRDDKADIQILRVLGELRDEALLREVHHNKAILNFKIFRDTASYFNQCGFPPGHQYYVDPRRCELPRKFLADSGRGTSDECPRAEPFSVNRCCHFAAPFYLLALSNRVSYSSHSMMVSVKYLVSITHLNYTKGN